jgi:hypothetical protein
VRRLAALEPQVKLVLGQHNIPVAQPSVLPRLVAAIQGVRAGEGTVKSDSPGKEIHTLDGFSFLLSAPR